MSKLLLTLGVASLALSGCGTTTSQQGSVSQLQVRELQTCTFDSCDVKTTMKAMINVLQDEGFIVKNAVLDLGLITAEKQVVVKDDCDSTLSHWVFAKEDGFSSQGMLEVSANVSEYGSQTRVRVNFQTKKYDSRGGLKDVNQPLVDQYYQIFFAKVSKGIFYQTENI